MMENKVSVIIPAYNTKQYLEACVASITGQTFRDIEILLIDDGSTDGTGALCDRIAEKDHRIRVIHKPNGGAATARNLGIDVANGAYVMFLDSDDWLDVTAIGHLVHCADEHHADVVRFNYVREFSDKQLVKRNTFLEERAYSGDECMNIRRQILGLTGRELEYPESMNFLASCGFNMYRTDLLRNSGARFIPIQEIGSFVDGLFNFQVFKNVKSFVYVDKAYYHYRKTNETAVTAGYRRNYVNRQLVLFSILKNQIELEDKTEFFEDALTSRIVYSTMEIAFNAMRNKACFRERFKEIRYVLHHEQFRQAYRAFKLKNLGLKWKVYFGFIKYSLALPTYLMTALMLKIKNRGVL